MISTCALEIRLIIAEQTNPLMWAAFTLREAFHNFNEICRRSGQEARA